MKFHERGKKTCRSPKEGNTDLNLLSFKCSWSRSQTQQMKAVCLCLCGDGKQTGRGNIHQSLPKPQLQHFKPRHGSFFTSAHSLVQYFTVIDWWTPRLLCFTYCLDAAQRCKWVERSPATESADIFFLRKWIDTTLLRFLEESWRIYGKGIHISDCPQGKGSMFKMA